MEAINKPGFKTVLFIFAVAVISMAATAASAGDKVKLKDITCEQFLAMDESAQSNVVYWIEGAATASDKKAVAAEDIEVGYDAFGRPVAEVATACAADKKASLWSKVKEKF